MRHLINSGDQALRDSQLQQCVVTSALMRHGLTDRVAWHGQIKSAGIRVPSARAKTAVSRGFVFRLPVSNMFLMGKAHHRQPLVAGYADSPLRGLSEERTWLCGSLSGTCELAHKQWPHEAHNLNTCDRRRYKASIIGLPRGFRIHGLGIVKSMQLYVERIQ
jgi:hypothetical protein